MKTKINITEVNFPTLYKLNTQGKVEQWSIQVVKCEGLGTHKKPCYNIHTTFGEYRGKQQVKTVLVSKGKNIGKKNETTVELQAMLDAENKHKKMLKKGYVKSLKDAKAGKTDKVIQGGIVPMAAHKWQDHSHKVEFPVYVQPKLDGERCVAIVDKKAKVTLWTRSRKPITACPHIIRQLESFFKAPLPEPIYLDGELYKHGLSVEELEKLKGSFRKKTHSPLSLTGEFHIYDRASSDPFRKRLVSLDLLPDYFSHVQFVGTTYCNSEVKLNNLYKKYLKEGFEGVMVRDPHAPYQYKRTKALLKYKPRDDSEFKIVNIVKGEDNTVVFECVTKEGKKFKATKSGDKVENQKYLKNKKKYIGKMLTVQYQGFSGKNNVPLFPSALRIREKV